MNCKKCNNNCVKNGCQANGTQRYYCKSCKLSQQKSYVYKAYNSYIDYYIYKLLINSCGISDIGRVLNISKNTVKSRTLNLSKQIKRPILNEINQSYEVDELKATLNKKHWYVAYAINKDTREVIDFVVGSRTKKNLSRVINSILRLLPKRISTDKLLSYKSLIPNNIHSVKQYKTNNIERFP